MNIWQWIGSRVLSMIGHFPRNRQRAHVVHFGKGFDLAALTVVMEATTGRPIEVIESGRQRSARLLMDNEEVLLVVKDKHEVILFSQGSRPNRLEKAALGCIHFCKHLT